MKLKKLIFLLIALAVISCKKDDDNLDKDEVSQAAQTTNRWIRDIMEEVYLWEDEIPEGLSPYSEPDPFAYFDKFIHKDDHWSWLSDDYASTNELYSGITTTSGLEFMLTYISDNYTVIGIVEYVMPNSPGDLAGVRRGDIITAFGDSTMNTDNYYDLVTMGGSYSVTLAEITNNTIYDKEKVNITEVENFQEDPILLDTVYTIEGRKIAYLMYNSFLDEYNTAKSDIFAKFKAAGVTDLIIDLRYNGGGSVAAEEHLANLIAPSSALGEIFSIEHYNELYTAYFKQENGPDALNTRIKTNENNINLSGKMIGLVTSSTASASEGLLNGLEPLLDLTLIGETTHGKYTGMWVLPDDNKEWVIIPIVTKSTNKLGVSVKGGMTPGIELNDDPLDGYQLGDIRETMLSKAIGEITGITVEKSTRIKTPILGESIGRFRDGKELIAKPRIIGEGQQLLIQD